MEGVSDTLLEAVLVEDDSDTIEDENENEGGGRGEGGVCALF